MTGREAKDVKEQRSQDTKKAKADAAGQKPKPVKRKPRRASGITPTT